MGNNISGAARVVGVIGCPVRHSRSPVMHNAAFGVLGLDWAYVPFDVSPESLQAALDGIRGLGITGINVTIPHKERVIGLLDWVSDDASRIGSVNTVHNEDGILKGYSTDGEGFLRALAANDGPLEGSKAVVLGAGGAARATVFALAEKGVRVSLVNRTLDRAYELAGSVGSFFGGGFIEVFGFGSDEAREAVKSADLLVNCTSVGMNPNSDSQPVPADWIHKDLFVFDQVYDPLETRLMRSAKSVGAKVVNGIDMLVFQGAISFSIWTGIDPPIGVMKSAVLADVE